VRLYLLGSPAVYGEDLRFSERDVEQVMRQALIPFWNSYVFLATYAKINDWKPKKASKAPVAEIDKWILSLLQKLTAEVTEALDGYELHKAITPLVEFIEQLTNWYIRRSRSRFWDEKPSKDRDEAFETLYTVLITLSKIAAPFIPFLTETVYKELRTETDPVSVHLTDFPVANPSLRDETLEK
jgi:isoleucyl-tRNA synthetase